MHVSGVPGLGCSVSKYYTSSSVLKLWEEEREQQDQKEKKPGFSDKLVKFFSLRRKKTEVKAVSPSKYSSVSLPKVSVRRSASAVTASNRTKVNTNITQESSENMVIIRSKSKISRSVSLHRQKMACLREHFQHGFFPHHQPCLTNSQHQFSTTYYTPHDKKNIREPKDFSFILKRMDGKVESSPEVSRVTQGTQTEVDVEDDDYDCVYR